MSDVPKERREELRVQIKEEIDLFDRTDPYAGPPAVKISIREFRALLDMADERDELISRLEVMDSRLRHYEEALCHNDLFHMVGNGTANKAIKPEKVGKVLDERDQLRKLLVDIYHDKWTEIDLMERIERVLGEENPRHDAALEGKHD